MGIFVMLSPSQTRESATSHTTVATAKTKEEGRRTLTMPGDVRSGEVKGNGDSREEQW